MNSNFQRISLTSSLLQAQWETLAADLPNSPGSRRRHSLVSDGGKRLFLFGGDYSKRRKASAHEDSDRSTCTEVFIYSPNEQKQWTRVVSINGPPFDLSSHCAVRVGNEMIVFGGHSQTSGYQTQIHAFDLTRLSWRVIATARSTAAVDNPGPVVHSTIAYFEEHLYVFGGSNGNRNSNDLWRIRISNKNSLRTYQHQQQNQAPSWERVTTSGTTPAVRNGHTSVIYQGILFIFGGMHDLMKEMNDLQAISLKSFHWIEVSPDTGRQIKSSAFGQAASVLPDLQESQVLTEGSKELAKSIAKRSSHRPVVHQSLNQLQLKDPGLQAKLISSGVKKKSLVSPLKENNFFQPAKPDLTTLIPRDHPKLSLRLRSASEVIEREEEYLTFAPKKKSIPQLQQRCISQTRRDAVDVILNKSARKKSESELQHQNSTRPRSLTGGMMRLLNAELTSLWSATRIPSIPTISSVRFDVPSQQHHPLQQLHTSELQEENSSLMEYSAQSNLRRAMLKKRHQMKLRFLATFDQQDPPILTNIQPANNRYHNNQHSIQLIVDTPITQDLRNSLGKIGTQRPFDNPKSLQVLSSTLDSKSLLLISSRSVSFNNQNNSSSNNNSVVIGKKPCPRDSHCSALISDSQLLVFGGDRHHMVFQDFFLFELKDVVSTIKQADAEKSARVS